MKNLCFFSVFMTNLKINWRLLNNIILKNCRRNLIICVLFTSFICNSLYSPTLAYSENFYTSQSGINDAPGFHVEIFSIKFSETSSCKTSGNDNCFYFRSDLIIFELLAGLGIGLLATAIHSNLEGPITDLPTLLIFLGQALLASIVIYLIGNTDDKFQPSILWTTLGSLIGEVVVFLLSIFVWATWMFAPVSNPEPVISPIILFLISSILPSLGATLTLNLTMQQRSLIDPKTEFNKNNQLKRPKLIFNL